MSNEGGFLKVTNFKNILRSLANIYVNSTKVYGCITSVRDDHSISSFHKTRSMADKIIIAYNESKTKL